MLVVIDTSILVSALWSGNGAPARAVGLVLSGRLTPCYDHRIMLEYRQVLQRPKFRFRPAEINALLDWFNFPRDDMVMSVSDFLERLSVQQKMALKNRR